MVCVSSADCAQKRRRQGGEITQEFELATATRGNLVLTAEYALNADGTHRRLSVRHGSGMHKAASTLLGRRRGNESRKFSEDLLLSGKWMLAHATVVNWKSLH